MSIPLVAALVAALAAGPVRPQDPVRARSTEYVILVTLDGLRWQEVFAGADNRLMNKEHGGVVDLLATRRRFWRGEAVQRRELLLPFLWGTVVRDGQLFGDAGQGARAAITNPHKFSYPGYSELLCGFADERIASNDKFPNPNVTVLEWLHRRPGFAGRVAAFSGWDVHPFILNRQRSGMFVESAYEPVTIAASAERRALLQEMLDRLPRHWEGFAWDAVTFARAREYWQVKRPRVLYLALGETDEWGHARRYDLYLQMANNADAMIAELWQLAQQDEATRGRTSLLVTVDHGRGSGERDWTDHGAKVDGAEQIWIAVLGPDTPALGVRQGAVTTQGMVAATVAALLGEDYRAAVPAAAPVLPGVLR